MFITILCFVSGVLIGLREAGDGVLQTLMLLQLTRYSGAVMIGTQMAAGAVIKPLGVFEHRRLEHTHWRVAELLIAGSVPSTPAGALQGMMVTSRLTPRRPESHSGWRFDVLDFLLGARLLFGWSTE